MRETEADTPKTRRDDIDKGNPADHPLRIRAIPESAIWWGAAVLLVIAVVSVWLLISLFGGGSPQDKVRLEAIKLAGSIVVGTGGAVALVLAARRQRATELQLLQQQRTAADTRHDAEERRISDLQASAGEQLGNEKAAVRLNGLYQLERLGQNHPDHRQTVVDVIGAYLRMPFTHPDTLTDQPDTAENGPDGTSNDTDPKESREELQVRLTAQRILAKHLCPDLDDIGKPTNKKFWNNISLDLTGAVLTEFDLSQCHITSGHFSDAHFHGRAVFNDAHFHRSAVFSGAQFHHQAEFGSAIFYDLAWFENSNFQDEAMFIAGFHDWAYFDGADFHRLATFNGADFHRLATFNGADFHRLATFNGADFRQRAEFHYAKFHDITEFGDAHFHDTVEFFNARCRRDADSRNNDWPEGWILLAPQSEKDGSIEGEEGAWGYLVLDTPQTEGSGEAATNPGV